MMTYTETLIRDDNFEVYFTFSFFYLGVCPGFGKQLKMDGFRLEVNNLYHYQTAFFDDNGTTQNLNPGDDFFFYSLRPGGVLGA